MSSRIIVSPKAAEAPTAPASSYDLGQKVRAAAWAGVFTAVLGTVLLWAILVLAALLGWSVPGGWQTWLGCAVVSLVAGLVVTCRHGYQWVVAVAARPWVVDDEARRRIYAREDAERAAAEAAAKAAKNDIRSGELDHDKDPATTNDAQRLHLLAIEILHRHVGGLPITRDAMEEEGLCSQREWNRVSELMGKIGLKRGYKLRNDLSFAEAWQAWSDSVRFAPGFIWPVWD